MTESQNSPTERNSGVGPVVDQIDGRRLLDEALAQWGEDVQVMKAIEEMSELTRELAREPYTEDNLDEIQDEIADVWILLEQLTIIYGGSEIDDQIVRKLEKLESKLDGGSP